MKSGHLAAAVAAVVLRSLIVFALAPLALSAMSNEAAAQTAYPIPTPNSEPIGITSGPDGALWFTENRANKIGRITTSGVVTEFPLSSATVSSTSTSKIVSGPDGALWYVRQAVSSVGRITTAGVITEFPIPTVDAGPNGVAVGSDGALWFSEGSTNKVGRVTTAGGFTEYPINDPGPLVGPFDLTAGPDGALWFAVNGGNKIGRITTAGAMTLFPVPTADSHPTTLVPGQDGAIWFTEFTGNKIGRVTTSGSFTEYPIPTANSGPYSIIAGANGEMWFTELQAGKIGHITTTGSITEVALPSGSSPTYIVPGPDGAMWYTEQGGNLIITFPTPSGNSPLVSSVLPTSRSVQVGNPATFFSSIINAGDSTALNCRIAQITQLTGIFLYQTTDPKTNALTGTANTPVNIPGHAFQTFLIAIATNAPLTSRDVKLGYSCDNANAAGTIQGVNTVQLTFDGNPVGDMIAVGLTPSNDGFARTGGSSGTGVFAIASTNVGAVSTLTARTRLSDPTTPVSVTLCETDSQAQCKAPAAATVTRSFAHNEAATFSVFLKASGAIAADPAKFRVFLEFVDSGGVVRGSTSTAVTTQ